MKKKTGHQTPEYRRPTAPPQPTVPPMPQVTKPKQPNKDCAYSTPCGWCTKWDKKCDRKIRHGKDKDLRCIKAGHGLHCTDVSKLFKDPWISNIP